MEGKGSKPNSEIKTGLSGHFLLNVVNISCGLPCQRYMLCMIKSENVFGSVSGGAAMDWFGSDGLPYHLAVIYGVLVVGLLFRVRQAGQ